MHIFNNYIIYFFIYGYIFLAFLKGYYPANETGILFIGFLIFMSLAFKFGAALTKSELDLRISSIYTKIHQNLSELLTKQLRLLYLLEEIKNLVLVNNNIVNDFINFLKSELTTKMLNNQKELIAFYINQQLNLVATHYLKISDISANKAELLALKNLVKDPALTQN